MTEQLTPELKASFEAISRRYETGKIGFRQALEEAYNLDKWVDVKTPPDSGIEVIGYSPGWVDPIETRRVYTLKSDKGGEELTNEVLERYGFSKIPHYTVTDSVVLDIGRNRYLSAGCVGTPNEMLWLGYNTHIDKLPTDLICLHNFDYDGKLTIERLELILKALNPPQP